MNTLLWMCQVLLALTFLFSGVSKSTLPVTRSVAKGQTGVEGLPASLVRFIGVCELLGVVALVVPWHSGIVPILTPAAALGLGIIMVLAARVHFRRIQDCGRLNQAEPRSGVGLNELLGLICPICH
jgi:DoxX-like family